MIIDISSIVTCENKSLTEKVQIELESFVSRLGEFPIIEKAPIDLQIANIDGGKLRISGTVDLAASIPCSRCLEEVPTRIHFDIDKEFRLENSAINDEEMEDIDYLIGFDLDVDKLIYGDFGKLVDESSVQRGLQGICKVCGMNLNKGDCNCQRTELDPRMAAIQDVFNKFKEV